MKAIIPVAGFGTRMLPATKSIPKEMLAVVDKPVIQYIVDECVQAGITEIIFVTHVLKSSVENYFDTSFELEFLLEKKAKHSLLHKVRNIVPEYVKISHTRQGNAKGLGHAILSARHLLGDSPFVVVLPDVLIAEYAYNTKQENLAAMVQNFKDTNTSQIMVNEVPHERVSAYGIVDLGKDPVTKPGSVSRIHAIIEKPTVQEAPSNLAVTGRYIFTPELWQYLEKVTIDKTGEIQLTNAISAFIADNNPVNSYSMVGTTFDCGNKVGYMQAILEYGIRHSEIGPQIKELIKNLI